MEEDYQKKTYEEVVALKDLFLRRLMDDKVKVTALTQMKEETEALHRQIDEKAVTDMVRDIILVCDRISMQEDPGEMAISVFEELQELLERRDFYRMSRITEFDPHSHNAVGTVEETEEFPEKCIVRYVRDGYCFRDRVFRPADVIVAVKKENSQKPLVCINHFPKPSCQTFDLLFLNLPIFGSVW